MQSDIVYPVLRFAQKVLLTKNSLAIVRMRITGRPDTGQHFHNHHAASFAHRTKAWVHSGKPFQSLQPGFRAFLFFYDRLDVWFFFRNKLQLVVAYACRVVNTKPPDFYKTLRQYPDTLRYRDR